MAGAGAALGRISVAGGDLRDGSLVMPLRKAVRLNAGYRIVYPSGSEHRPQVALFIAWVVGETGSIEELCEGLEFV